MHITHAEESTQSANAVGAGRSAHRIATGFRRHHERSGICRRTGKQGGDVSPLRGEDLQRLVTEVADISPELAAKAKAAAYLNVK